MMLNLCVLLSAANRRTDVHHVHKRVLVCLAGSGVPFQSEHDAYGNALPVHKLRPLLVVGQVGGGGRVSKSFDFWMW